MSTTEEKVLTTPNKSSKSALSISIISIIIGVAAIGISTHNLYHAQSNNQQFKTLSMALNNNTTQQTQQIQALQKKISQLENNQHSQIQRTIAEISYLVHLANLNLVVGHNPTKALETLTLVQNELANINNDALVTFKNALNTDIAALQATPAVPTEQLFSEIATINQNIEKLSPLPTQPNISLKNMTDEMKSNDKSLPWYRRLLESLKQVKTLFIIRHLKEPNTPLVFPALEMTVKQNITTQLNMAQWALLHRDATIYVSALQMVSQWLSQYFSLQPGNDAILKQIDALEKVQIDVALPNLNNTLTALSQINTQVITNPVQPPSTQAVPPVSNPTPPTLNPAPNQKNTTPNTPNTQAPKNNPSGVET